MPHNTASAPTTTPQGRQGAADPKGRWDLWLLGVGVVVLLVIWLLDPFFQGPMPPDTGTARGTVPDSPPPAADTNLFQERIVATPQYDKDGVVFDLPAEKARLEAWLEKDGHRDALRRDPTRISTYHALGPEQGGRITEHLQWFPHKVGVDSADGSRYELPYAAPAGRFPKSKLDRHVVPLFTPAELARGPADSKQPLVEYVPVNMHERGFTVKDLDPEGCRAGVDGDGRPAFFYRIKPASRQAYGDFSAAHIGFECAVIVSGYVVSVPCFGSRITEQGVAPMRTQAETKSLVEAIRASPTGR